MTTKRNGEIDLLRFFFAVIIVIHHFNALYDFGIFKNGPIGVEFFFVVSGFLMAKHVEKRKDAIYGAKELGSETWRYVIGKVRRFFGYYVCAILFQILVRDLLINHERVSDAFFGLLEGIPTFTLTFMGLNYSLMSHYVGNTWFLSSLILACFFLYPFLLKNYEFSSKVIFPLLSLFLLGYLYGTYHTITGWTKWTGFAYFAVLRAIAEIALGASLCPLSGYLCRRYSRLFDSGRRAVRILVTLFKYGCYGVVFAFASGSLLGRPFRAHFDLHALLFCALGVLLSFSNAGYTIPESRMTRYLGRISLPIFIFHGVLRWSSLDLIGTSDIPMWLFVLLILLSIVVSVGLMYLTDLTVKSLKNAVLRRKA